MRCAILLILTLFLVGACQTADADNSNSGSYAPLPMEAFKAYPTASIVASATPVSTPAASRPTATTSPSSTTSGTTHRVVLRGEASWGPFGGHVVTRYPRGTTIRVCGFLGCTAKLRSYGYGPARRTGRIADLDGSVFEKVCGDRYILGVCQIRLEVWK